MGLRLAPQCQTDREPTNPGENERQGPQNVPGPTPTSVFALRHAVTLHNVTGRAELDTAARQWMEYNACNHDAHATRGIR